MRSRLATLFKEPLTHFLLIGAALFLIFQVGSDPKSESPDEIVVTRGAVESLARSWEKTRQRPPTAEEMKGLIEAYIREEVLYREALAMGLEREDTIIKRRLGQKMTFLFDDVTDLTTITDEQLLQYLREDPEKYRVDPEFTFSHVYLNADRRGDAVEEDALALLAGLRGLATEEEAAVLGDPFLLPQQFESLPQREVARTFGMSFAESLAAVEPGRWEGPLRSGYGLHLVLVRERTEGRLPELDEIRDAVTRDFTSQLREENSRKFYERLRGRYRITVEMPEGTDGSAGGEDAR